MAVGRLPKPGKVVNGMEIGACIDRSCAHSDCEKTREMANQVCPYCNEKIGYETAFYELEDGRLVHAICEEKEKGVS